MDKIRIRLFCLHTDISQLEANVRCDSHREQGPLCDHCLDPRQTEGKVCSQINVMILGKSHVIVISLVSIEQDICGWAGYWKANNQYLRCSDVQLIDYGNIHVERRFKCFNVYI